MAPKSYKSTGYGAKGSRKSKVVFHYVIASLSGMGGILFLEPLLKKDGLDPLVSLNTTRIVGGLISESILVYAIAWLIINRALANHKSVNIK